MLKEVINGVTYRNKKNKLLYRVNYIVKHSETLEDMVVYTALYKNENPFWVRPYNLFLEKFEEISQPIEYTYEKVMWGSGGYQVRLRGEFITYVDEINDSLVDKILKLNGFDSREEYYRYITSK